ncbi:Uridine kinase [Serendipita sp. 399]|nr:Uridine kinase [Serendipita sp. 399]
MMATSSAEVIESSTRKNTVLKSHGRLPWYNEQGISLGPAFTIGIAGGSASGKTHVAHEIVRQLGAIPSVVIMSQDSFYKWNPPDQIALAFANEKDFDHPDSLDLDLFANIFVQCDSDLMLARRIRRDVAERGRDVNGVIDQYLRFVKPSFDNFVQPSSRYADIILPPKENASGINLVTEFIRRKLSERSANLREKMALTERLLSHKNPLTSLHETPEDAARRLGVLLVEQTPQVKGIYTVLRDQTCTREDFIFYSDRLSTLLVERAMAELPFRTCDVTTPMNTITTGKSLDAKDICGLTIIRWGGPLERGLQRVVRDIPIGCLVIQPDPNTSEPMLMYSRLPSSVRERHRAKDTWVFILGSQIGTGSTAFMAIRILLDHGVSQDHIVFITFLVSRVGGIGVVLRAFPRVRIVTGAIDDDVKEIWRQEGPDGAGRKDWKIEPGIGDIEGRYF